MRYVVRYRDCGRWRFVRDVSDHRKAAICTSRRSAFLCASMHPSGEVLTLEDENICLLNAIN